MTALTPLAVQNADVLRELRKHKSPDSIAALAKAIGRDKDNLRKTLIVMETEGLIGRPDDEDHAFYGLTDRGCAALKAISLAERADELDTSTLQLRHDQIHSNPLNPRDEDRMGDIAALAETIHETGGLLQNLVVFRHPLGAQGEYTLYAGERRWRAVALLIEQGRWPKSKTIPCVEREADAASTAFLALVENGQHEPLSEWDEAKAMRDLADAKSWSAAEVARRIGREPRLVQIRIKVAREATDEAINLYLAGGGWDQLRDSVEKPKAAPKEPEKTDLETMIERVSERMLLALVELQDKIQTSPSRTHGDRTEVDPFTPKIAAEGGLIRDALIDVEFSQQKKLYAWLTPKGLEALNARGFDLAVSRKDWSAMMGSLRYNAFGSKAAEDFNLTGKYTSSWLNEPFTRSVVGAPIELTPASALALIELADKIEKVPAASPYIGYTQVGHQPSGEFAGELERKGLVRFVRVGGLTLASVNALSSAAGPWLTDNGFHDNRSALLTEARARLWSRSHGSDTVADLEPGEYLTAWLNVKAAPEANHSSSAPRPKAEPEPMTRRHELILVELAHKICGQPAFDCPIGRYWLDALATDLTKRGLIGVFIDQPSKRWRAKFDVAGFQWLSARGFTGDGLMAVDDDDVEKAQRDAGLNDVAIEALAAEGFYATEWLRDEKTEPARQALGEPSADDPDDDVSLDNQVIWMQRLVRESGAPKVAHAILETLQDVRQSRLEAAA